jgi:hypothetical protein
MAPTLAQLTRGSFEPLLHQRFALRAGDAALELELVEVKTLGAAPRANMREPFSLLFHGPSALTLRQGTYALTHGELGEQHVFIVPIARDSEHTTYQAIFT